MPNIIIGKGGVFQNGFFDSDNNIITDQLALSLDVDDSSSWPGSGTTWFDVSGNNEDFTLENLDTSTDGQLMTFDASNERAERNTSTSNLSVSGSTYEAWVNVNWALGAGNEGRGVVIAHFADSLSPKADGVFFQLEDRGSVTTYPQGSIVLALRNNDDAFSQFQLTTNNRNWSANTWHHVVVSWDNTAAEVYEDGIQLATKSNSKIPPSSLDRLTVGNMDVDFVDINPFHINGAIPIFRAYNKKLTSAEVLQNYNAEKSRFGL